jgi:hypothetical protein
MSRSDNQPSLQRGIRACVREWRPQFGYWLFGCTQMASRALVAGAGKRFESAPRLTLIGWNRQGAMATRAILAEVRDPTPSAPL